MAWCVIKFDDDWNAVSRDAYEQGEPHLESGPRHTVSEDPILAAFPWLEGIEAMLDGQGNLTGARLKTGFTPPEAPQTIEEHLMEIKELTRNNLLASEHDRRWLAQKEAAKREGIPWLKSHPSATQAEFETAMTAALAAELPGEPLVIHCAGLIASYAAGAQARGLIAAPTFEALRDLVAATPEKQLQKLLAKL